MSETLTLTPKILELNEDSNDIYMTVKLCILSNQVNYNNAKFTDDFIQGVIENKSVYVGIPLVANKTKLENGVFNNLTHEYSNGKLNTDMIGSFIDFWEETDDTDAKLLMGEARIYKRFPSVCEAIAELFGEDDLEFSCEVLVNSYESLEDNVRSIHYNDGKNSLIGSCVVSEPAESRSKATLLIAEALKKDLENMSQEGDENMSEQTPVTEVFNKGHEIKYHGQIETSSLKFSEVSNQIYNLLNPVNPKTNYRQYNYYIDSMYVDFVIVEDWEDYSTLFKIGYKIENDIVVLAPQNEWIEGYKGFIPKNVSIDDLMAAQSAQAIELNNIITELNQKIKEAENMTEEQIKELQSKFDEATAKVDELNSKVNELNETIVSQEEAKKTLEGQVTELNSAIEDLSKYKEQVETAEKEAKQKELSEKYSKLLSQETQATEEFKSAIAELNSVALNEMVVAEVAKEKVTEVSSKTEQVVVTASKQEDLIPETLLQKYGIQG